MRASNLVRADDAPMDGWHVSMHSCLNSSQVVLSSVRMVILDEYFPSLRVVNWIWRRSVLQTVLIGPSTSRSHSVMVLCSGLNSGIEEYRLGCAMTE